MAAAAGDIIYMFAMSLDGFIARRDGGIDWLDNYPANADFDFDTFLDSVTGIVMGRGTFDIVSRHAEWHYAKFPCVLATRKPTGALPAGVEVVSGPPQDILASLRRRGANGRIWILGGGDIARQFLEAGLLDTIEIGTIPVILGDGIPAFGGAQPDRWCSLEFAKALKNGAVHTRYAVRRG